MSALRDGPLEPRTARDLVASGHGEALIGCTEGEWLDVKSQPYAVMMGKAPETAAWEMAKDIAAFANAGGGIIVIPGRESTNHGSAIVEQVDDMPLERVSLQRARAILAVHVYPTVEGLEVAIVETSPGRGTVWIYVPEQPEQLKPFLVKGALAADKVVATHVSIPRRVQAETFHAPIAEIHAQLVAGRARRLGREEILELVRRDQLPWGVRELVDEAEVAGVRAAVGYGVVRFETPDGRSFQSDYAQVPESLLGAEVSRLCQALEPYGVAVRRASSGLLIPGRLQQP